MAEPNWISVGGLVASAFSALAAYLAIRQTIIIRRVSNKVQIITKTANATVSQQEIDKKIILGKLLNVTSSKIDILNVGLGPALRFKYQWVFDYEKYFPLYGISKLDSKFNYETDEYNNALIASKYSYIYYMNGNSKTAISIIGYYETTVYSHIEMHDDIAYVLPWSVKNEEEKISIPSLITSLLISNFIAKYRSNHNSPLIIEGPNLIIYYEDISGTKHKKIFSSIYRLNSLEISEKGLEATFTLSFSQSPSWTTSILQKIRKSYTDFIFEYDSNKNNQL